MMGKMRSLAPWFILTVGGLFVLFMVLSDSNLASFVGQQRNVIGSINGTDVTYQEFSKTLENAKSIQQQQGREIEESQMAIFRDQVWDAVVSQRLLAEKIEEFGITVTDEEVKDALLGPNPPADLRQSFIDSTGNFNREMYETALFDPRNKEILLQLEDRVRQEKMQSKLQNLLFASITVTDEEVKRRFVEQNMTMSAEYAFLNYNSIPDTSIEVGESEIQSYYNAHKDDFREEAKRKIKYVLFKKEPSKSDSTGIIKDLEAILTDLESDTSSFKTYVEIYSEEPYAVDSVSLKDIPEGAKDLVRTANTGAIVGPVLTNSGCFVYRVLGKTKSAEPLVKASHILIKGDNDEAKAKADDLYKQLQNGADFATLAALNSEDKGNALQGGDLGWFGRGQMVTEFNDACFNGRVNQIQRPLKTRFGYHIIKVTGKNDQKYIVEKIVRKLVPSGSTLDNVYNDANDFAYLAQNNGFDGEAELLQYDVRESYAFNEETKSIPGLGQNEALTKFAFENSVGSVGDVFQFPTGYVVAVVSEEISAGYKLLDDVSASIKNSVRKEKKSEQVKELVAEMKKLVDASGDLNSAKEVDAKVKVDVASQFNATGRITGVGEEFAFTEFAMNAELNKVSDPIKGTRGCFLIKLTERTPFDSTSFSAQKYTLRENLLRQKKSRLYSEWIVSVKEEAEIEDNRYNFWR